MGEAELELRMEDVCAYLCVCMCVKLDPLIQKPSPGTTAGTRLLLGLSTVAPQEQQKTPPNAPCSSSVSTHTWKHAATHKCTTYTSSKPTALSKHSKTHCFSEFHMFVAKGHGCWTEGWGERVCTENSNKVDSWTARSTPGSHRLCLCAATHTCRTLKPQDNVLLCQMQNFSHALHKQVEGFNGFKGIFF